MSPEIVGPVPAGADPERYDRERRGVLWSMPTGLYVVGSVGVLEGSRRHNLMTANLVVQVATAPKLVAAAVERDALSAALVAEGGCFSVSLLRRADRALVRRFAKPVTEVTVDDEGRPTEMAGQGVVVASTGAPVLAAACAWLDCTVVGRHELGSHVLFVGEVVAVGAEGLGEGVEVLRMDDTRMHYGG